MFKFGLMLLLANFVFLSVLIEKSASSASVCGVRGKASNGRGRQIVGGETALPLEFPWQISLHRIDFPNRDRGLICGGSIINEQYVDTAAHCVEDGYNYPSNYSYMVVVGEQNLHVQDPHEEKIAVTKITIHPKWNTQKTNYDYALLKLARPLDFAGTEKALMPICLPRQGQDFVGQMCTASGWGLTKDASQGGTVSESLQKVDLRIQPQALCRLDYVATNEVVRETMVCAGPLLGGKGSCNGDSGGPLQCARSDGRYVLVGSTSWGTICAAPSQPTVYARISTQVDWIKSIVGPTP